MLRHKRRAPSLLLSGLILGMFLFTQAPAHAAVAYYPVAPITEDLSQPVDVAVSPSGLILVVNDPGGEAQGMVYAYNRDGVQQFSIPVDKPNTVAAGTDYIYVGSNADLSVKIYDSSGNNVGDNEETAMLGSGAGEFQMTINVVVDPITNYVYVVDLQAHKIKIYEPTGAPASIIDDGDAAPQDIAFNDTEIYLLDMSAEGANMGAGIRSTRVVVFDRSGNLLRSYTNQGSNVGQIFSAKGIAVDNGHFYVSDAFHGVVLAFTSLGVSDGAIQDSADAMRTPTGLAVAPEGNKLFVVSPHSSSVKVFVNDDYVAPPPPAPTPTPTPAPTPTPTPVPTPTPTPVPTPTPTPVPTPTPTPVPTPTPTPEPTPPIVTAPEPTPDPTPVPLTKKELKKLKKAEKKRLQEERKRLRNEERRLRRNNH